MSKEREVKTEPKSPVAATEAEEERPPTREVNVDFEGTGFLVVSLNNSDGSCYSGMLIKSARADGPPFVSEDKFKLWKTRVAEEQRVKDALQSAELDQRGQPVVQQQQPPSAPLGQRSSQQQQQPTNNKRAVFLRPWTDNANANRQWCPRCRCTFPNVQVRQMVRGGGLAKRKPAIATTSEANTNTFPHPPPEKKFYRALPVPAVSSPLRRLEPKPPISLPFSLRIKDLFLETRKNEPPLPPVLKSVANNRAGSRVVPTAVRVFRTMPKLVAAPRLLPKQSNVRPFDRCLPLPPLLMPMLVTKTTSPSTSTSTSSSTGVSQQRNGQQRGKPQKARKSLGASTERRKQDLRKVTEKEPSATAPFNNNPFNLRKGSVVWAKMERHPYWPSQIYSMDSDEVCVLWLGSKQHGFVPLEGLEPFHTAFARRYNKNRAKHNYQKAVAIAISKHRANGDGQRDNDDYFERKLSKQAANQLTRLSQTAQANTSSSGPRRKGRSSEDLINSSPPPPLTLSKEFESDSPSPTDDGCTTMAAIEILDERDKEEEEEEEQQLVSSSAS